MLGGGGVSNPHSDPLNTWWLLRRLEFKEVNERTWPEPGGSTLTSLFLLLHSLSQARPPPSTVQSTSCLWNFWASFMQ